MLPATLRNRRVSTLTVGLLVAQTTDGGASGRARVVVLVGPSHPQPPLDSLHPSLLLPSHFSFGGNYLFLKRAPEQTRWEIPLNKSSLFPDSLSLALQTKLVGWGWDFPRPLLVWGGLAGGGSSQECQAAAAAPLLTAGRAGALPPRSRESQPPPLQTEGT